MTIAEVNELDLGEFVARIGWVFEDSPWVAERTWSSRPFASRLELSQALASTLRKAARGEQLGLLKAHPDLGTRARMSEASAGEQSGAGLDQLSETEFFELRRVNEQYKEKFGFPFLYAVRGSTTKEILTALRRRLDSRQEAEFEQAIEQVQRIAEFRLEGLVSDGTVS